MALTGLGLLAGVTAPPVVARMVATKATCMTACRAQVNTVCAELRRGKFTRCKSKLVRQCRKFGPEAMCPAPTTTTTMPPVTPTLPGGPTTSTTLSPVVPTTIARTTTTLPPVTPTTLPGGPTTSTTLSPVVPTTIVRTTTTTTTTRPSVTTIPDVRGDYVFSLGRMFYDFCHAHWPGETLPLSIVAQGSPYVVPGSGGDRASGLTGFIGLFDATGLVHADGSWELV